MKQTVRIIGGLYRGKKLPFPDVAGLRPTPDRVRETLFNWLMHSIREAHCLDAFAGSGALGFEALSRGAKSVVLVEQSIKVYANLQLTAATFNASHLQVVRANACAYLKQSSEHFNVVFLDPPFSEEHLLLTCLETLSHSSVLIEGGLLYLEAPNNISINPYRWETLKSKKAGAVVYSLLKKRPLDKDAGSCFNHSNITHGITITDEQ
jgi:16S rRNA (guanine966-N2)-methyltransferase